MAIKKKIKPVEVEVVATPKLDSGVIRVTWRGQVREYSSKIHGADYAKLASEFAQKHDGVIG